jgi:GH35 family endo-1,4-beta-xylanase
MSLPFTKFGLSSLLQSDIDGYTGELLPYMFDTISCTSAVINITTNTIIAVNSNLTAESMQYITRLAPYSNTNDLLSYIFTTPGLVNTINVDRAARYASNNNLELLIFGSFEGIEFGENPRVRTSTVRDPMNPFFDVVKIGFDSDIVEIGGGGAERKMLLASNFDKPLFCNILRYYISSIVNYNFSNYGMTIQKYIVMNESRTTDFRLPTSANEPRMWKPRSMLKILDGDFIPFFFKAYGDALPRVLRNASNSLYYMDAATEFIPNDMFQTLINQLLVWRNAGTPIHGYAFQAHLGELFDPLLFDNSIQAPRQLSLFESNINYVRQNGFNTIIQEYDFGANFNYNAAGERTTRLSDRNKLDTEIRFNNSFVHICMNHGAQTIHNWYEPYGLVNQIQFLNVCNIPLYGRSNRPTPHYTSLQKFVKWYRTNRSNSFNSLATVFDYNNQYVGEFPSLKQVALDNNLTNIKFGIIVANDTFSGQISQFTKSWIMDSIKYAYDIIVPPNSMKMGPLRTINTITSGFNTINEFKNVLGNDFNSNRSFRFNGENRDINVQLYSNTNNSANAIANYAFNNNLKVRGHTLSWHVQQPQWLIDMYKKNLLTFPIAKTILSNHVTTVLNHYYTHYPNTVTSWDVINELVGTGPFVIGTNTYTRIIGRVERSNNKLTNVRTTIGSNYLAYALDFPYILTRPDETANRSEVFRTAFNSAWSATPSHLRNNPSLFYNDFELNTTVIDYLSNIRGNYRTGSNPFQVGGIAIDGIGLQGYIRTYTRNDDPAERVPLTNEQIKTELQEFYDILCYAKQQSFTVDITESIVDIVAAGEYPDEVIQGDYGNQDYAKVYRNWVRLCLYAGVDNFISWDKRMFDSNGNPSLYYTTIVNELSNFDHTKYGDRPPFNTISLIPME